MTQNSCEKTHFMQFQLKNVTLNYVALGCKNYKNITSQCSNSQVYMLSINVLEQIIFILAMYAFRMIKNAML